MNSPNLKDLIAGSDKLTAVFMEWPSFQDAEVTELHFARGEINQDTNTFDFPVLTIKLILWSLTSAESSEGLVDFKNQTLAVIQFSEIDSFSMEGFNYQNSIYGLSITPMASGDSWQFEVKFDAAFGMSSRFACGRIEVLNAVPWNRDKRPPGWLTKNQLAKLGDTPQG